MKPFRLYRSARLIIAVISLASGSAKAGPGAHGPDGEHLDQPEHTHTAAALQRLPDGSLFVPKLAQRRMSIRTQVGVAGDHALPAELNGQVIVDPNAGGRRS